MGKMFDLVTKTCNFLGGECHHKCIYCWSQGEKGLVKKYNMKKYYGKSRLIEKEFTRKFKPNTLIFICDMLDLFGSWVPYEYIQKILQYISKFPETTFLLLTKNPKRYNDFFIPENCIIGVTVESDVDFGVTQAPHPRERLQDFAEVKHPKKMVSIEPIMKFNLIYLVEAIKLIKPMFVYVGYDNYGNRLDEPSIEEVDRLVVELEKFTEVRLKDSVIERRKKNG